MNKKFNYTLPLIFALVVAFGMFIGAKFQSSYRLHKGADPKKVVDEVLTLISNEYVDDPDKEAIVHAGIEAMLKKLDPHSVYIPASELKVANEDLEGNFEGIGVEFNILEDTIVVVSPISGGPSEEVGIRAGDRFIKINNKVVAGVSITNQDVFDNLRGQKGTKVIVTVKRPSMNEDDTLRFTITRDKIPLYSLDASYMASPQTGYIKINRFSATTIEEFKSALSELRQKGMRNLILDLRGNPGGYLTAATQMADEFLPKGDMIVYTQGRARPKDIYRATSAGSFEEGKVVVLIDEGSASASEIVSGALQDQDRALIIGRRSFGKGLVQEPFMLSDESGLRLTVARYYTPSGRSIQKPYNENIDEYYNDLQERYEHGEMLSRDSIRFVDSLKYYTANGREVYGGGGIMPDVFTPIDTGENSDYLQQVLAQGIFTDFTQTYMDANRASLQKRYKTPESFIAGFEVSNGLLNRFTGFAANHGIPVHPRGLELSKGYITNQLKALIARQLFREEGYFRVVNSRNSSYIKALEAIEGEAFEQNSIRY